MGRSEPTEGTEVSEQERDFPRTLAPSSHCPTPSLSPEPLGTRGHRAWWPRLCALQPPHPAPPSCHGTLNRASDMTRHRGRP